MNHGAVLELLTDIGESACDRAQGLLRDRSIEERSAVHRESRSDVIYAIDREVEKTITTVLEERAGEVGGVVLVAEGIGEEEVTVYPRAAKRNAVALRVLMDPIDGTRGLMYDKRSAFFLAGAAPNQGDGTRLSDVEVAVMVELPTTRSQLSDTLWAIRGQGARGRTRHLADGSTTEFVPAPSPAKSIRGGFAQISRFFPPGKDVLARIEEELLEQLFPDAQEGEILSFEDQYISTGGQLYEMLKGRDRFIADVRAGLFARPGAHRRGHVCHPYDMAALLVGTEGGLIITGRDGRPLDAVMDTALPLDWVGYANQEIFREVAATFTRLLHEHGLL